MVSILYIMRYSINNIIHRSRYAAVILCTDTLFIYYIMYVQTRVIDRTIICDWHNIPV